jgi:hypothetical protein
MAFSRNDLKNIEGMTEDMIDGVMSLHQVSETARRQAMDALQGELNALRASTPGAEVMTELDELRKWKTDREEADRVAAENAVWNERFDKLTDRQWSTQFNRDGVFAKFRDEASKEGAKSDAEIFTEITKGQEDALFVAKRQAFVNPPANVTATESGTAEEYMASSARYKNNPWVNKK